MKYNPLLLPILLGLLLVAASGWIADAINTQTFSPESRIWVTGTSSLHDWSCEVNGFNGGIDLPAAPAKLAALTTARVQVPATALDCKNGTMDKKAADALRAKESPVIRFTLASIVMGEAAPDAGQHLAATGTLQIAGVQRKVTIDAVGYTRPGGTYRFTGALPLRMTDFEMKPPTAILGTLKTGDEIVVHFDVTTMAR